jgi:hypothetical protein
VKAVIAGLTNTVHVHVNYPMGCLGLTESLFARALWAEKMWESKRRQ